MFDKTHFMRQRFISVCKRMCAWLDACTQFVEMHLSMISVTFNFCVCVSVCVCVCVSVWMTQKFKGIPVSADCWCHLHCPGWQRVGECQQRDGNVSSSNCEKHYTLCMCVCLPSKKRKRKKGKKNRLMVVLFGILSKCTMASPQCTAKCRLLP